MKEKVRPIYQALMGCLSSAPLPEKQGYILESPIWEQFHRYIDKLNELTKEDYNEYKLSILSDQDWGQKISVQEYRSKLNSLIMYLHGQFFPEESFPFSGSPGVVVSQVQQQSQNAQIIMITQFQDLIDKRLYGEQLEPKEKSFLEKIKAELPNIKSVAELIQLVISISKSMGMDINQIAKIFGVG